ncbi:hypothetical protein NW762_013053 [Fusarium torreyae]|uniref:Fungal N-terminal domain-containing protein n=1 Tax=Fusarium torreyae TaxID=1237075 RepID=A0A9W8RPJ6_9HYPO|nr:hypothetical protein NW762_013053 [Fusarium torreyae]
MDALSVAASYCQDVKKDLDAVNRELSALTQTLSLLKELVPDGSESCDSSLTNSTQRDIREIIEAPLMWPKISRAWFYSWALKGGLQRSAGLLVEKGRATAKNIKHDTTDILDDTAHIKGDIGGIMERIRKLEGMIAMKDPDDPRTYMLRRYLNDLSSVAGSVCDMSSRPVSPEPKASVLANGSTSSDADESTHAESMPSPRTAASEESSTNRELPANPQRGTARSDAMTQEDESPDLQLSRESYDIQPTRETDSSLSTGLIGASDVDRMEPTTSTSSLNLSYAQIRPQQILQGDLYHLYSHISGSKLSSDGTKVVWKTVNGKRDIIYDIDSGKFTNAMQLSIFRDFEF